MELFTIYNTNKKSLYHATTSGTFTLQSKATWFAHNEDDARKYGKKILKFNLTKTIKLIDISNQLFHLDFIARINNMSSQITTAKLNPLVALGLPDLASQLQIIGYQNGGSYNPGQPNFDLINQFVPLFGNKHRYSDQSKSSDIALVKALIFLYPDFDGYTCTNYWPSYHHGGFLVPETCLFKPQDNIVQDVTFKMVGASKKEKRRKSFHKGGGALKPGETQNEYGGVFFDLQEYCVVTGVDMNTIIRVNPLILD